MNLITIPEMIYESWVLKNKKSDSAIRTALRTGKLKGSLQFYKEKWQWTAEKQDFLNWLGER